MIKYSLIAMAAAAVLFSVGCDDSECCGTGNEEVNVKPVINRILGVSNNSTKSCTPGESISLVANATDENNNLDTNTYSWVEKVGNNENTLSSSITCPADGESTQICATVKDKKNLESDEVCINLKGKAVETTCPTPVITVSDAFDNNKTVTALKKSHKYYLSYQEELDNCPNMSCSWSVRSLNGTEEKVSNCFTFEPDGNDHGEESGTYSGTWIQTCMESAEYPFDTIEINLTCTGKDTISKTYEVTSR